MLLRDISWCCKEVPLPSKVLWRHGMCCSAASLSKPVAKCALHLSIKVTCSSVAVLQWYSATRNLYIANRPSLLTVYLP